MTTASPIADTSNDLEIRMLELVADLLCLPEGDVRPSSRFVADLGADSLDVVELIMAVEEAFSLEIPDEDADALYTVAAATDYVRQRLAARGTRPRKEYDAGAEDSLRGVRLDALTDLELNWAVARVLGRNIVYSAMHGCYGEIDPQDSIAVDPLADFCNDWAAGGPLVQRYNVSFSPMHNSAGVITGWRGRTWPEQDQHGEAEDSRQLRCAMLAIVAQHCGPQVQVPAVMQQD